MVIQQHTINTPYMVGPVHCYTAERGSELILFDTGPPTAASRRYLAENIDLSRLKYIFMTHCHIDHYGLASWLEKETGARIFIPYRDGLKMVAHEERLHDMYVVLQNLGFSGDYLDELHRSLADGRIFPDFPKKFSIVEDEMPRHLDIFFQGCPGHSQSDIVYYTEDGTEDSAEDNADHAENWAVTGDVLLRGVFQSPLLDADLETGERFKNYEAYCATLLKLAKLRGKQICPGHRNNIDSVDDSLLFYVSKMLGRVRQLGEYGRHANVAEVIERLFADSVKEPFHVYLKASEIIFMQDFLHHPELLKKSLVEINLFHQVEPLYTTAVSGQGV
ncbi:MBL fold metallo-hydrolase [Desulfopila inferna]|uniref:MBL fold metallo-hydrolase n=1 Tax=Desulfopila inferna TaxID=468528 RepID=UPI001964109F|nr:MBL fold metallo-hydrolase [Desulfopila inferna]MBM9603499.1 MBL fold metallo-hydrolase [Desulfopila inferna]